MAQDTELAGHVGRVLIVDEKNRPIQTIEHRTVEAPSSNG
jgi:hypothetical protein